MTFQTDRFDSSGNKLVSLGSLLSGENQQFARLFGGAASGYSRLTASGQVGSGPRLVYGFKVIAAGSSGNFVAYDATSALAGNEITETIAFGSLTAGQVIAVGPAGYGLLTNVALYCTIPTGAVIQALCI
jgi:hypothetical protein